MCFLSSANFLDAGLTTPLGGSTPSIDKLGLDDEFDDFDDQLDVKSTFDTPSMYSGDVSLSGVPTVANALYAYQASSTPDF